MWTQQTKGSESRPLQTEKTPGNGGINPRILNHGNSKGERAALRNGAAIVDGMKYFNKCWGQNDVDGGGVNSIQL